MDSNKMNREEFSQWLNKTADEQSKSSGLSRLKVKALLLKLMKKKVGHSEHRENETSLEPSIKQENTST
jgi:hypothetical protein